MAQFMDPNQRFFMTFKWILHNSQLIRAYCNNAKLKLLNSSIEKNIILYFEIHQYKFHPSQMRSPTKLSMAIFTQHIPNFSI